MGARTVIALTAAYALALTSPVSADPLVLPIDIKAGSLPDGLQDLERQTGIELLYDHSLVNGLRSQAVAGDLTTESALQQLLADTTLVARRADSGAWIVELPDA